MHHLELYKKEKVLLTIVNNPFNFGDKTNYLLDHQTAKPVGDYVADRLSLVKRDIDLVYSLSGKVLEEDELNHVCPNPDDQIVVIPLPHGGGGDSGKNIGRIIGFVVITILTIITYGATAELYGPYFAAFAAAAVSTVGGLLVNAIFPIEPPTLPALPGVGIATGGGANNQLDQTDTYGWGEMRNPASQGIPIPKIYGKRRVAGNIISRYVDIQNNDEYYNALMAVNNGNIQGITNIEVNGQPIDNYNDVWYRTTLGTRDQEPMKYFLDTYGHQTFNAEITDSTYVTKTTIGNAAEGIKVEVVCPYGLYYTNTQGGLDQTYVEISIEYKESNDADWTAIQAGQGGDTIYTDFTYTQQGFKFASECESVTFHVTKDGMLQYRTGTGYTEITTGWIDFRYTDHDETITINGLGRQPTEVRLKGTSGDVYPVDEYFPAASISRTVSLGGDTGNVNIIGAQNKPLRRAYEVRGLDPGQYSVRMKKVGVAGSTGRYQNDISFVVLSEIIPDDFAYPYIALLGIRALATSQLSGGAPSVTAEVIRSHVPVYNTNTETWVAKRADNPAWASYDILVKPFYKMDMDIDGNIFEINVQGYDGVDPTTRIDYDAFQTWADWCDTLIDDEKRATINIVFDSQMDTWQALLRVGQVGRGMVLMRGTKFSCVIDKTTSPTQLFNVANIYEDTLKETFLPLEDRANIVEVTYFDETRDYQRETIQVYGNGWQEGDAERRANITLYGCTSYNQAYREAKYRLNSNKFLTRTVEFDVDIDAIACQVGDVIRLQHNLPQWGFGGRVLDATWDSITLDQEVEMDGSTTYTVLVRHADDSIEQKTINGSGSNLITNGNFETDTTGWSLTDATATIISGGYIDDNCVDLTDNGGGPKIYQSFTTEVGQVYNFSVYYKFISGGQVRVFIGEAENDDTNYSFTGGTETDWTEVTSTFTATATTTYITLKVLSTPSEAYFDGISVYKKVDAEVVTDVLSFATPWSTDPSRMELYTFGQQNSEFKSFKVTSITRSQELRRTISAVEYNSSLYTEGTPVSFNVSALKSVPVAYNVQLVERLNAGTVQSWISEVHMTWNFYDINERRFIAWDIYRKDTTVDNDVWEYLGRTKESSFVSNKVQWQYQHTYQVAICGVDLLAERSHNPDNNNVFKTEITIAWKYAPPDDITGFQAIQDGTILIFSWDHVLDVDRRGYEIRQGPTWASGNPLVKEVSANTYTHTLTIDGTYRYWIKAIDTSGNYSTNATQLDVTVSNITSLLNIVYTKEELDDFIDGIASTSNVTDNLIWVGSGNTIGLHVPHSLTDSGVSTWTPSGSSLEQYSGTTQTTGSYVSPIRDIGASAISTLRLYKEWDSDNLYVTDLTYPDRTDQTYPRDTDINVTDNSTLRSFYRVSDTSPLTSLSWVTYAAPSLGSFRYFQRKEIFNLDSIHTQLAYTSIESYVDVPDKTYTFNSKSIGASGTTFTLSSDLGITMFVNYMVALSVVSNAYYPMVKNKTLTSFFAVLFDDAGSKQSGQVDILIKGY